MKRVLVTEDFNEDVVKEYKEKGFSVHVLSKRKIRRKDKKVWNKIQRANLDPALDLKFGSIKELNDKYKYDIILTEDNPILTLLENSGKDISKYQILEKVPVSSRYEAETSLELMKDVNLKFITIKTVFTYELKPEFSGESKIISTSRDFCKRMVSLNKAWSLEEISNISGSHLTKMGLPNDVFAFTGGYYREKGTTNTSPSCRHQWLANVVIER